MNEHIAVVLRQGEGGLAFKVKMFLSADFDLALDLMRGVFDGGGVAVLKNHRLFELTLHGQGVVDGQKGRQVVVFDFGLTRGLAGVQMAVGDDQKNRLAVVKNLALGKAASS